jgi:hypothetical protein
LKCFSSSWQQTNTGVELLPSSSSLLFLFTKIFAPECCSFFSQKLCSLKQLLLSSFSPVSLNHSLSSSCISQILLRV